MTSPPTGLSNVEAERRVRQFGANEVASRPAPSAFAVFRRQLTGSTTWLLAATCGVSLALHEMGDAVLVGALLGSSTLIGFVQEWRAERTFSGLRARVTPQAPVIREGRETLISIAKLVPGDLIVLRPGSTVYADARLLEADRLSCAEEDLSGQTQPAPKRPSTPEQPLLEEQQTHVFRGTRIVQGTGLAEVCATGPRTAIAKLADPARSTAQERTLLERQLEQVSKDLLLACLGIVVLVALSDLFWGRSWADVFLTGVTLAVAALPEGLPLVVTLALAAGARHLAARHVLVRNLDSIETVGSTTVICTGKTGVLSVAGSDLPRAGTREAIARAKRAGIRTVLLTGDAAEPSRALAREVGILGTGAVPDDSVHAEASAARKLEFVSELKQAGHVVAMTGESTNNAPALRAADVGFSLYESAEVTREASDMVLLDDDFSHLLEAIQVGRGVFDNVRKAIVYLMAGNLTELAVMFILSLSGSPVPLSPVQLLWINLVTDGPPALALALDPVSEEVLQHRPRPRDERLLGRTQWQDIGLAAALQTIAYLGVFLWSLGARGPRGARNLLFEAFVFGELFYALVSRKTRQPIWRQAAAGDWLLIGVVVGCIGLQLVLRWLPVGSILFDGTAPSLGEDAVLLSLGLAALSTTELVKSWRLPRSATA